MSEARKVPKSDVRRIRCRSRREGSPCAPADSGRLVRLPASHRESIRRRWVAGSPVDAEQTFKPKRISYAYDEVRGSAVKAKRDVKIDWRAPERLFDEPDELVAWARA